MPFHCARDTSGIRPDGLLGTPAHTQAAPLMTEDHPMKTISRSKHATALRTVVIGAALMIGSLTTLHAEPADTIQQHASAANSQHRSDTRPDWNVDYPSQLGPQGIITSDGTVDTHHACDVPTPQARR
jgi:hypothetical protein